ncbi:transglycosylase domain-containing protein [Streptomyces sp. V3I7]|uniref:transglycosylase domain-containing protein n=1 Tax=Streptomyces sp. V3I7 TaxID=3042278 RepID=UPI0027810040|nr:transglycosylase domain-containing protein [Streptomyces sp. V3I7]MDQ0991138.1 membrane peptidoglycan carboxypeptidase [Streptomyces sp. V3I7]
MSDEPQPQQPDEGGAPREPQAAPDEGADGRDERPEEQPKTPKAPEATERPGQRPETPESAKAAARPGRQPVKPAADERPQRADRQPEKPEASEQADEPKAAERPERPDQTMQLKQFRRPDAPKAPKASEASAASAASEASGAGARAGDEPERPARPKAPASPFAPPVPQAPRTPEPPTGSVASQQDGQAGPAAQAGRPDVPEDAPGAPARRKRTGWRRAVPTWRMVLGTLVIGVLLLAGAFFVGYSLVKIPSANALATQQGNVYLYADGSQLARDGEVNRENVRLSQISKAGQHAVLAAEDRDFYTESAVDLKAMVRAAWNTATGKGKQSGSTITQQYVKNYYLAQEQTVTRKVKEFFISIKLDRNQPKDKILEGYLNTSYFGRNAYGVQAAAQAYYGVDAIDLDPARAAYLAALVNAPSEYDVVAHPENKPAALARWNYVLDGMVKQGWLPASERAGIKFPMPKEQTVSTGLSGQRGYIVEAVKHYLDTNGILDAGALAAGGYRITTTLDKGKQDAFVKAVDDQVMSQLDKKNRKVDSYVRAGGASIDPRTGKIVAMYGGVDYVKQYTNGATRGDFQVGSTFKPFVFTSAVENHSTTQDGRTITPNTYYDGTSKRPVQGWDGGLYNPENEDGHSYGQITVREATDKSVNSVYAQMAVDVGSPKVKQTAIDLGLPESTPDLTASPSIALGPSTASVLDMTRAYATLANHGKHGTYTMIQKITRNNAEDVPLPAHHTEQAVSRQAADTTTSVLQSVVAKGTATAALAAGRPAAGKTGTAEEDTAAWFAGYTPELATVVSVMGQDPVTARHKPLYGAMGLARINGGGAPAEIWAQYTKDALKGRPVSSFDLQLQPGADKTQPPVAPSSSASGTGDGDQGAVGGGTIGGDDQGQTAGQTTGGTDGGTTGDPGDNGGTPTDGGVTGGPGPTDGGITGGTTDGGTTTGGTDTGGTTTGGTDSGGTTDGGTTAGPGGSPPPTRKR